MKEEHAVVRSLSRAIFANITESRNAPQKLVIICLSEGLDLLRSTLAKLQVFKPVFLELIGHASAPGD